MKIKLPYIYYLKDIIKKINYFLPNTNLIYNNIFIYLKFVRL